MFTNDPLSDFHRYDSDREDALSKLPVCDKCRCAIQQEKAVYYNSQWICEDCEHDFWYEIREDFLERVEDE